VANPRARVGADVHESAVRIDAEPGRTEREADTIAETTTITTAPATNNASQPPGVRDLFLMISVDL
jgi:hypothetical protein